MDSLTCYLHLATDKKDSHGMCPIYINVVLNRVLVTRKSTKTKILEEHWDKKSRKVTKKHPSFNQLNARLSNAYHEVYSKLLKLESEQERITKEKVRDCLAGRAAGELLTFYSSLIERMSATRSEQYIRKLRSERRKLKDYAGDIIEFKSIDYTWLKDYEYYLVNTRGINKETSLNNIMAKVIMVLREAEIAGYFDIEQIKPYKPPRYVQPEQKYLTLEQTEAIWDVIQRGTLNHSKTLLSVACYFLVECYAGIRFSDWGKFKVERILHEDKFKVMAKKNKEPVYIPLGKSPRLRRILAYIKDNKIVFDLSEPKTNEALKLIGGLIGLDFPLTTHKGRHTCATLLLETGYSEETIAEWLGISTKTVKTYAKFTRRKITNEYERLGGL